MNCTDLASPENGNVDSNGVIAIYTCIIGYYVSGDEERTCNFSTGMWSGSDPVCQRMLPLFHLTYSLVCARNISFQNSVHNCRLLLTEVLIPAATQERVMVLCIHAMLGLS